MSSRYFCISTPRILAVTFVAFSLLGFANSTDAQNQQPRKFAKGIVKTIKPVIEIRDTHTIPMKLPNVNAKEYSLSKRPSAETLYKQSESIFLFKGTWQLEFQFLNLRQMEAMIPTAKGPVRQNVWYLVYRVRNVGKTVTYRSIRDPKTGAVDHELEQDKGNVKESLLPNRFFPKFVLQGWVQDGSTKQYSKVQYLDGILPTVVDEIQNEEDPNRELLDSVEVSRVKLEVEKSENGGGVWGVAVFTGVNPNIDYVSVSVSGLTNAYRIEKSVSGEVSLRRKTLQLNFWRPGDTRREKSDKIDYGIPLVDNQQEQVNITRFYNLPGPLLRVYEFDKKNDRYALVTEADAEVDMQDFKSKSIPVLNSGSMTEKLAKAVADAGIDAGTPRLTMKAENAVWEFSANVGGQQKDFEIRFEPQYWEKDQKGIRFIKSLDHLWIYR